MERATSHFYTSIVGYTDFLRINVLLDIVFKLLFSAEQEGTQRDRKVRKCVFGSEAGL